MVDEDGGGCGLFRVLGMDAGVVEEDHIWFQRDTAI
jgi:hypothetical protein